MANYRDSIAVRPLHEELESLGLDAGHIIGAVQANSGLPVELSEAKDPYVGEVRKAVARFAKAIPMTLQVASAHKIPWRFSEKWESKGGKKRGGKLFQMVLTPDDVDDEVEAQPAGDFLVTVSQVGFGKDVFDVTAAVQHTKSGGKRVFHKIMVSAGDVGKLLEGPAKKALVDYLKKHDFEVRESVEDDGEELDEQMQVVKVQKLRGAQLAKARQQRRKLRAAKKAYSKKYYARSKRKIAKRRKKALAKFGKKGLERLHKQHKRVMTMGLDRLATLQESLEENIETTLPEQVAVNAGWLAVLLGEIFECVGQGDSAETLYELSDSAADLADRLSVVTEESLSGRNEKELEHLVMTTAKALEIYEGLGSPSLWEAVQYGVAEGLIESKDIVFAKKYRGVGEFRIRRHMAYVGKMLRAGGKKEERFIAEFKTPSGWEAVGPQGGWSMNNAMAAIKGAVRETLKGRKVSYEIG